MSVAPSVFGAAGVGLKLLYDPAGTIAVDADVVVCPSHADASRALLEFSTV